MSGRQMLTVMFFALLILGSFGIVFGAVTRIYDAIGYGAFFGIGGAGFIAFLLVQVEE